MKKIRQVFYKGKAILIAEESVKKLLAMEGWRCEGRRKKLPKYQGMVPKQNNVEDSTIDDSLVTVEGA